MLSLDEPIILHHGSTVEVSHPDLALCSPRKDFGRGFYLTSSFEQAASFARIVARRAQRQAHTADAAFNSIVSSFRFEPSSSIAVKRFPTANAEWLHCIVAHRKGDPFAELAQELERYDVITGKVANDQTNATLLAYIGGLYGDIGSVQADGICISLLLPDNLQDQVCFRTSESLSHLTFLESRCI